MFQPFGSGKFNSAAFSRACDSSSNGGSFDTTGAGARAFVLTGAASGWDCDEGIFSLLNDRLGFFMRPTVIVAGCGIGRSTTGEIGCGIKDDQADALRIIFKYPFNVSKKIPGPIHKYCILIITTKGTVPFCHRGSSMHWQDSATNLRFHHHQARCTLEILPESVVSL
jgi:hypothetical protein